MGVRLKTPQPCEHTRFSVDFSQNRVSQLIRAKQSVCFGRCLAINGGNMNRVFYFFLCSFESASIYGVPAVCQA